jgi:FG-GAP-like repeat
MAFRLGLEPDFIKLYSAYDTEEMGILMDAGIYPEKPQIANEDWLKIVKYFVENSPERPIQQAKKEKVTSSFSEFTVKKIYGIDQKVPGVTCVKFNSQKKEFYVAWRGQSNFVKKFNMNLSKIDSFQTDSPVSDIFNRNESIDILTLGIMDPSDKSKGSLLRIDNKKQKNLILDKLSRPVQMSFGDLNDDQIEDIIICNFGNETGDLTWYEGGNMKPHLLNSLPGARQTYIKDMNGDKIPDIVVLMTQAREGIFIYYNKGKGVFDEKRVLDFPSVFGSSYIDLVDFNKDGFMDFIYSNGDNADLSMILKSYHGIRIFLNDTKGNFNQTYFYPMHGAAKAVAADFDLDGDLDIAAISFFTNPKQTPHEGFLMLNNQGNFQFKVSTFKEANFGKWMVMDVADMDNDGDKDIILGSFLRKGYLDLEELKFKGTKPLSAIILENKKIK